MSNPNVPVDRPLSPHLQIFRPIITMVMSIVHRITGVALYFGMVLVVWWLMALAAGPEAFATASAVFASWPGQIVLIGFTWALSLHLLGGIRHLVWDLGYGFDLPVANAMAWGTLVGSVVLTAVIWIAVCTVMG